MVTWTCRCPPPTPGSWWGWSHSPHRRVAALGSAGPSRRCICQRQSDSKHNWSSLRVSARLHLKAVVDFWSEGIDWQTVLQKNLKTDDTHLKIAVAVLWDLQWKSNYIGASVHLCIIQLCVYTTWKQLNSSSCHQKGTTVCWCKTVSEVNDNKACLCYKNLCPEATAEAEKCCAGMKESLQTKGGSHLSLCGWLLCVKLWAEVGAARWRKNS